VLADVDPATMNIDPMEIEKRVTLKTKAVIPVHFVWKMLRYRSYYGYCQSPQIESY